MSFENLGISIDPTTVKKPHFVVFDFETGGFSPKKASPTQLAMEIVDRWFTPIDLYHHRIFPTLPVSPDAARVNGYSEELWRDTAIPLDQADDVFYRWVKGAFPDPAHPPIGICHGSPKVEEWPFDFKFLYAHMPKTASLFSSERWDSCVIFKDWRDRKPSRWDRVRDPVTGHMVLPNCKLASLAVLIGEEQEKIHDAFWDTRIVVRGLKYLMNDTHGEVVPSQSD